MARREREHGVEHEPHFRPDGFAGRCDTCGYTITVIASGLCPECGRPLVETPPRAARIDEDHSALDEPALGAAAHAGPSRLAERTRDSSWALSWVVTAGAALAAGPWAVLGVLLFGSDGGVFAAVVAAPIVEEAMKVAAAALVLERWPHLFKLRSQLLLAALAGAAVFSAIENLLYLSVYFPEIRDALAPVRWGMTTPMHVACTAIASVGLLRARRAALATGRRPDLTDAGPFLVMAMAVHGLWNVCALLFEDRIVPL